MMFLVRLGYATQRKLTRSRRSEHAAGGSLPLVGEGGGGGICLTLASIYLSPASRGRARGDLPHKGEGNRSELLVRRVPCSDSEASSHAGGDLRRRRDRCFDRLFSQPPRRAGDRGRADRIGVRGLRQVRRIFGTRLVRRDAGRSS